MKQEAMNVLLTRRSVRQYQARQVSEQEIDQVLQAGLYAPTGKNVQGVELVAVQEKELRDRLAALNKSFWDKDMDPYYGAPTIILVLADTVRYTWVEDGSCALCNMLNAAHALGYGGCWMNAPALAAPEIDEYLGKAGEGLRLMSLVPIGRPAYTPREKPLRPDAVEFRANEEA